MIVLVIVIVTVSVVVSVWICNGCGVGVATTPGQSISPASTETVSANVRMIAAHMRSKVFM